MIGLLPVMLLGLDVLKSPIIVNPIQYLTLRTGKAALVMVVITLACTPLNSLFGFKPALKARRTFGLYTFIYAFLHVSIFFGVDYFFNFQLIWLDLNEKRYILAGAGSFLILLPLAVTSFRWWMKRLGKTWKRLHRLVYLGALLAAVHYIWLVKSDIRVPVLYAGGILLLLMIRIKWIRKTVSGWRFRRSG
jgi:sulfoxide reductase heme-binding subunit YedZ